MIKKDKHIISIYERAILVLETGPFDGVDVKKLVNVTFGEGQWRMRLGNYRVRYDIHDKNVVLHSIRDRKDSYR